MTGSIRVPGDKSMSHRAIMLGSIAEGCTTVSGFLEGEDALATLSAFREMGVEITDPQSGRLTIDGAGLRGLKPPTQVMDVGNSGTSIRLMAGLLAKKRCQRKFGDQQARSRGFTLDISCSTIPALETAITATESISHALAGVSLCSGMFSPPARHPLPGREGSWKWLLALEGRCWFRLL